MTTVVNLTPFAVADTAPAPRNFRPDLVLVMEQKPLPGVGAAPRKTLNIPRRRGVKYLVTQALASAFREAGRKDFIAV